MAAPEKFDQEGNGAGRAKSPEHLNQMLVKGFHPMLPILHSETKQVRDGFFGIVHDGVKKAMVDSGEPLPGGAEQIIREGLRILRGAEDHTSSFHGLRYSRCRYFRAATCAQVSAFGSQSMRSLLRSA